MTRQRGGRRAPYSILPRMSETPASKAYADIVLPTAVRMSFTYSVPPELREQIQIGHRVRVPFGRLLSSGYVVGFQKKRPALPKIRAVQKIHPPEVLFPPEILSLAKWVADYYLASWGQVLESILPRAVKAGVRARKGKDGAEGGSAASGEGEGEAAVGEEAAQRGAALLLSPDQAAVTGEVLAALDDGKYQTFLLHGVTASGKTEIYLAAVQQVVQRGGQVLFLVPEIAMGTQILARVRARFGDAVGLYHSRTGDASRREVWRRASDGSLRVVVGARSAVFVPMPNLRLIVIDEEHESAYKQDETPRYHGRDTALMRARAAGAVVVLGSATPSLESIHNVELGKYRRLLLPERIDHRLPAHVTVVDMADVRRTAKESEATERRQARLEPVEGDEPPPSPEEQVARRLFSPLLRTAIEDRLARREQAILFLNRRGHSTVVQCSDCGAAIECKHCDVVMTWHKNEKVMRCHYCNAQRKDVTTCDACQGSRFFFGGFGTQRVEETLRHLYPEARVARMDQDAMRKSGEHARVIGRMEAGEIDLLLGTQMLAKGFHFPDVTLVGVLQADREMLMPDLRASERAFQILTQVAGRSGRGDRPGEVIFQTLMPTHYVITSAVKGDYDGFAAREMAYRQELRYPPYHRMVHLLFDGAQEQAVRRRSEAARELIVERVLRDRTPVQILGPAPMPLSRLKDQYRWHLTIKGKKPETLGALARLVMDTKAPTGLSGVRVQADVDPMTLM